MIKKIFYFSMLFILLAACRRGDSGVPQLTPGTIDEVIAAMTLEEKAGLLVGDHEFDYYKDGTVRDEIPDVAGTSKGIPRLGIPVTYYTDGPAGVNIAPTREGTDETFYCTAFPIATMLAATWNPELVREVGEAIGNEALEYGCDIVQSQHVGTSLKHFAANNQETFRRENDSRVSQRALRELYLKGFEMAVREAHPWTIMSSYNLINGTYASESYPLLTTILRDEWGFNGFVMTDWTRMIRNTAKQIHAGNEMMMPGFPAQIDDIVASFSEERNAWVTDKGIYKVQFAASADDIRQQADLKLKKEIVRNVLTKL